MRCQVKPLQHHISASGQSDQEFCCRISAFLDDGYPVIIIEPGIPISLDEVPSRAAICIVELDPDEIEYRIGNSLTQLWIRYGTLGCSRDIKGPGGFFRKAFSKTVDHGCIPYCISRLAIGAHCSLGNKPTIATILFNIKVKPIHGGIPKWARPKQC